MKVKMITNLRKQLSSGLAYWAFVGLMSSWWLIFYASLNRYVIDYVILSIYLTLIFIALGLIVGLAVATLLFLISLFKSNVLGRFKYLGLIISGLAFSFLMSLVLLSNLQIVNIVSGLALLIHLVSLTLGFLLAYLCRRLIAFIKLPAKTKSVLISVIFLTLLLAVPAIFGPSTKRDIIDIGKVETNPTGLKVAMIGVDAACWNVIDPLIKEGKLQTYKMLVDEGASGVLMSRRSKFLPMRSKDGMGILSPSIWESIATGLSECEHGIFDFHSYRFPGMNHGVPLLRQSTFGELDLTISVDRRRRRIWEILDNKGLNCLIVGWLTSWPTTPLQNGVLVSNRFHYGTKNSIWPLSLDTLPAYEPLPLSLFGKRFTCLSSIDTTKSPEYLATHDPFVARHLEILSTILDFYSRDRYYSQLGYGLYKELNSEFFSLYVEGIDIVEHMAWKYYEPQYFHAGNPVAIEKLGCIIPEYYQFTDEIIEDLFHGIDSNTILMVLSDHGQGPKTRILPYVGVLDKYVRNRPEESEISGYHQIEGMIAFYGPHIKKGYRIHNASVMDIAPTLLYIYGFPIARDMLGRPLLEVFEDEFVQEHPVSFIDTYGCSDITSIVSSESKIDDQIKKQLKTLGYIE